MAVVAPVAPAPPFVPVAFAGGAKVGVGCVFAPGTFGGYKNTRAQSACQPAFNVDPVDVGNCALNQDPVTLDLECDVDVTRWMPTRLLRIYINNVLNATQYIQGPSANAIFMAVRAVANDLTGAVPPTLSIKNARTFAEHEFHLRDDPILAITNADADIVAYPLRVQMVPSGPATAGLRPPALTGMYLTKGTESTKLHTLGVDITAAIPDHIFRQVFAPSIATWVVLWWTRPGNSQTMDPANNNAKFELDIAGAIKNPYISAYLPFQLIKSESKRDDLVQLLQTYGQFDDRSHTFRMELPPAAKRKDMINPQSKLTDDYADTALMRLYIEVLFNSATVPDGCLVAGGLDTNLEPAVNFAPAAGGHPETDITITLNDAMTPPDLELLRSVLSSAIRGFTNKLVRAGVFQPGGGAADVIRFTITVNDPHLPAGGVLLGVNGDFENVWRQLIGVVMAKWYCLREFQTNVKYNVVGMDLPVATIAPGAKINGGNVIAPIGREQDRLPPYGVNAVPPANRIKVPAMMKVPAPSFV